VVLVVVVHVEQVEVVLGQEELVDEREVAVVAGVEVVVLL